MAHQVFILAGVKKQLGQGKIRPGAHFFSRAAPVVRKGGRFGMRGRIGSYTYAQVRLLLACKGHQVRGVAKVGFVPVPRLVGGRVAA